MHFEIREWKFETRLPNEGHKFTVSVDLAAFSEKDIRRLLESAIGIDVRAVLNAAAKRGETLPTKVVYGGGRDRITEELSPEEMAAKRQREAESLIARMTDEERKAILARFAE